jgi:hypothetical protein
MLILVIVGILPIWKLLNYSVFFNGEGMIAGWNPRPLPFIIGLTSRSEVIALAALKAQAIVKKAIEIE